MPTYEYKCTGCEEIFEFFQKITDPPVKDCPVCGKPLKKLVSGGVGIIFKGSGFYTTDYRKSSEEKVSSSDKSKKEEKKESKTENKTKS